MRSVSLHFDGFSAVLGFDGVPSGAKTRCNDQRFHEKSQKKLSMNPGPDTFQLHHVQTSHPQKGLQSLECPTSPWDCQGYATAFAQQCTQTCDAESGNPSAETNRRHISIPVTASGAQ